MRGQLLKPVAPFEQITLGAAATALTVPTVTVNNAKHEARVALIQCEAVAVRWRDDGTDPTASVGMRLVPDEEFEYDGDLKAIKFIREAAGAKLNVSYYR
jgi:hypothetical protein